MKKIYLLLIPILALISASCSYDDGWYPTPPGGWNNTFYDSRLEGSWQLVQANGRPVYGDATNYMDFYRNGLGTYYYYHNGYLESERMAYYCQETVSSAVRYQINVQYEYGNPTTMYYWFQDNGDTLWLQWGTNSGTQVYVYRYITSVP